MLDDHIVHNIMVKWLRTPKDIMNMGLVCRQWYFVAKRILLERPEAKNVNTLMDAFKLGWPCVIAFKMASSDVRLFPGMEIIEACVRKDRKRLRYICDIERMTVDVFIMGTHGRLGRDSPISILTHWLVRSVASIIVNNKTKGCYM